MKLEIKNKKAKLEEKLKDIFMEFEEETEVNVSELNLLINGMQAMRGSNYNIIDVRIKLEL